MDQQNRMAKSLTTGIGTLLLLAAANLLGYTIGMPAGAESRPVLFFLAGLAITAGPLLLVRARRMLHHLYRDPLSIGHAATGILLFALLLFTSRSAETSRYLALNAVALLVAAGALRSGKEKTF